MSMKTDTTTDAGPPKKRLVAFIDTSAYAESVCDYSAWLGARAGFDIELVHVLDQIDKPATNMSGTIGLGARTNLLEQLTTLDAERAKIAQAQGRAVLEDASYRITRTTPTITPSEVLRSGGIVDATQTVGGQAALVVVGKRGDTRDVNSGLIGTNLEAVIRASKSPVLVANRAFSAPKKFLLAYDGGDSANRAVDHIAQNNGLKGLNGMLVAVGAQDADLGAKMTAAADRLTASGTPCQTQWREGPSVEDSIVDAVAEHGIDLLVMGAYGHSRIRNLVIGSTTTAMVQRCRVPVLMFR